MTRFRLRRADFIRNFSILSAAMAVAYAATGYWAEAGATCISAGIGIPLAAIYLRRRTASIAERSLQ